MMMSSYFLNQEYFTTINEENAHIATSKGSHTFVNSEVLTKLSI